ncbi:PAS domain S-box protein [Spirosoma fluminis]
MTGDQLPLGAFQPLSDQLDITIALQAAGLGIWDYNPLTNQVRWDERCRELFGIGRGGQFSYEITQPFIHPDDVERVNRAFQAALSPQSSGNYQITYRTIGEDERIRWIQSTGRSYFNETGQPVRFSGVAQDVTQQVEARQRESATQQEAQRQQRIYEAITGSTPDLVYVFDLSYRFTYVNQALLTMWGSTWEAAIGKSLLENGYEPWHAQMHEREIDQVVVTKQPIRGEVAFPHATLGRRIYDYLLAPVLNQQGEVEAVAGITRDITEQIEVRQTIKESEAKLRSIINSAPTAIGVFVGPDMIVENPNQLLIDLLGQGPDLEGKSFRQFLSGVVEEDQKFIQIIDSVRTSGQPFEAKEVGVFFKVERRTRYFNISFVPLRDESGAIFAVLDVSVDVTEQVAARQKLEEAESSLREAVEIAQLGTWSIDVATQGLTFSNRLVEWFGYDPKARSYNQVIPILEAGDQERVGRAMVWALNPASDGVYNESYTVIHPKTGQKRILHARGRTVFDASGKAVRLNGTAMDITPQRELQLALEQQVQQRTEELAAANEELMATNEELESNNAEYAAINEELEEANQLLIRSNDNLQTFAYVASHDLQEPLRKIQQFGDLLKSRYADSVGEERDYIERMQLAASRMSTLIKDLLNYSRISTQRDTSGPVPLDDVFNSVLSTLELTIQETGTQVRVESLPTVVGDASQLGQLFQNLLANALKFRRPDAVPHIEVKASWLAAEHLPEGIKPSRNAIAYHRIDVIDNGIGFDEKYLDRIFQVFQRLHSRKEFAGTGIGLAICEKVAANHGGAITAHSQPGQGATFSVYLPV